MTAATLATGGDPGERRTGRTRSRLPDGSSRPGAQRPAGSRGAPHHRRRTLGCVRGLRGYAGAPCRVTGRTGRRAPRPAVPVRGIRTDAAAPAQGAAGRGGDPASSHHAVPSRRRTAASAVAAWSPRGARAAAAGRVSRQAARQNDRPASAAPRRTGQRYLDGSSRPDANRRTRRRSRVIALWGSESAPGCAIGLGCAVATGAAGPPEGQAGERRARPSRAAVSGRTQPPRRAAPTGRGGGPASPCHSASVLSRRSCAASAFGAPSRRGGRRRARKVGPASAGPGRLGRSLPDATAAPRRREVPDPRGGGTACGEGRAHRRGGGRGCAGAPGAPGGAAGAALPVVTSRGRSRSPCSTAAPSPRRWGGTCRSPRDRPQGRSRARSSSRRA